LDDADAGVRRRGVGDLTRLADGVPLGRLAVARIFETVSRCDDPFVVSQVLRILEKSDAVLARKAARTLLAADSMDIRQRACEVLKKHGEGWDLPLLAEQLNGSGTPLVRAALEAITEIVAKLEPGEFPDDKDKIADELLTILPKLDPFLQVYAAATLHYLGNPVGAETLQRLSLSNDSKLQNYVARTLGTLNDPAFVPILIRLLKIESGGVRQAALESLPKVVGEDIGDIETPETRSADLTPTQKKVLRWELWANRNS
jgi:HEAT repeat protein